MENIKILEKGELTNENIVVLQGPKKLKTRGIDYINIKNTPATIDDEVETKKVEEEKVEEPKVENEEIETKVEIEKTPITIEEKTEEDKIGKFAYRAYKPVENIDPNAIEQIRELGGAYRGQTKVEEPKEEKPKKEEKKKITEEDFCEALKKESYSPKTKRYKDSIEREYRRILDRLADNKRQIEEITATYGYEKQTAQRLQDRKSESQKIIDGINALDLNFLVDRRDGNSINALTVLETLFNEHRQIIIDTIQEIKKSDERKQEIGQKEQAIRSAGARIINKKNKFEEENYPKLESINKMDDETRKLEESLTEVTGIDDRTLLEEEQIDENSALLANVNNGEIIDNNASEEAQAPVNNTDAQAMTR